MTASIMQSRFCFNQPRPIAATGQSKACSSSSSSSATSVFQKKHGDGDVFVQRKRHKQRSEELKRGGLIVRKGDLGGNYGDSFADVDNVLINYFTFKALKSTLAQMQETDVSPGKQEYKWLYNFAAENNPNNGASFIRKLFAAGRKDHAERLIRQREDMLNRWIKMLVATGGADVGIKMQKNNLELLREHMMQSVSFASEDGKNTVGLDGKPSSSQIISNKTNNPLDEVDD